jgi:REP element-mobilizing transposase RayT
MPRAARLDYPNLLQHVMVRGIEKKDIFLDDADRSAFLQRFSHLLQETATECLAWALMKNHVHLLLRPRRETLATFMRRLLTGYAVTFNRRHHRAGHLFQNRYKSIVCEEDPYLLELVRYIHLNPLRAGAVKDVAALDRYPWCGHAVLLGTRTLDGQNVAEVLGCFGNAPGAARVAYRGFVVDGAGQGRREDLCGGGLRRVVQTGGEEEPQLYDARVLGSGAFVKQLMDEGDKASLRCEPLPLDVLVKRVGAALGVSAEEIRQQGRSKKVAEARSLISYLGYRQMGHSGEEVARVLGISRSGVCRRSRVGEKLLAEHEWLRNLLEG